MVTGRNFCAQKLLELARQQFGGVIFGRITRRMLIKNLLPNGVSNWNDLYATSSRLFILDRANLKPLFCCAMMRGGCGKITIGQEHQDGARKVVMWRLFYVYDSCRKITSPS